MSTDKTLARKSAKPFGKFSWTAQALQVEGRRGRERAAAWLLRATMSWGWGSRGEGEREKGERREKNRESMGAVHT